MDKTFRNFLAFVAIAALIVGIILAVELSHPASFSQKCGADQGQVYQRTDHNGKDYQVCLVNGQAINP